MQVQFDFAAQRISIEGDSPDLLQVLAAVRELAPQLSSINIVTQTQDSGNAPSKPDQWKNGQGATGMFAGAPMTMRQFVRSISLDSAMERIAAVAYYQRHHDENESFSPKQMDEWFVQCGFQKPANMSVTFADTRRTRGFIENVSRGEWRITRQGENLILGKLEQPNEE